MISLPELPSVKQKCRRQITAFLGLNRTDNTQEGELRDSYGVSTAGYPFLTQRDPLEALSGYSAPADLFEWDGKLVVVDDGLLYYDGTPMINVTEGRKQFAVVNTKLCIFPDKVYVDVANEIYGRLDAAFTTSQEENSVVVTSSTFTAALTKKVAEDISFFHFQYEETKPYLYSYGTDRSAVEACWDSQNAQWVGLDTLGTLKYTGYAVGEILIPQIVNGAYRSVHDWAVRASGAQVDQTKYNSQGCYCVVTRTERHVSEVAVWVDVYRTGVSNVLFSSVFSVGDVVDITGTPDGTWDVWRQKILSIDDSTNTLTFADNTFPGSSALTCGATVRRAVPDLDFICQSGNRLWGVSNGDRTIYASALGIPWVFYDYGGASTDSYAVAVGSEGEFTAVSAYDGSVLCWKENRLHKVIGSYPAEYYMAEATIPGVQKGSERSLQVINETLYYQAVDGVYTYSGGTPVLISRKLGRGRLTEGVGGALDGRYYLSVRDGGNQSMVLVYDGQTGLWMKEQAVYADAFALVSGVLHQLTGGTIYRMNSEGEEVISWMVEFAPFLETAWMRKGYSRLYLRFDMAAGSWMKIEIRLDERPWRRVWTQVAGGDVTKRIPIHLEYCDRFAVRLQGKGRVVLRSMGREFLAGSDGE